MNKRIDIKMNIRMNIKTHMNYYMNTYMNIYMTIKGRLPKKTYKLGLLAQPPLIPTYLQVQGGVIFE